MTGREYNQETAEYVAKMVKDISKEMNISIEKIQFVLLKLSENGVVGFKQIELESLIADEELKVKLDGLIRNMHDKMIVSDAGEKIYLNNPAWHYLAKLGMAKLTGTSPRCLAILEGCASLSCPVRYSNSVDLAGDEHGN